MSIDIIVRAYTEIHLYAKLKSTDLWMLILTF